MSALIPDAKLTLVEKGFHEWILWYLEKLTSIAMEFIQQVEYSESIGTDYSFSR